MAILHDTTTLLGLEFADGYAPGGDPKYGHTARVEKNFRYGLGGCYGYPNFPKDGRNVGQPMYLEGNVVNRPTIDVGTIWRGGELNQFYTGSVMANVNQGGIWTGTHLPDDWGAEAYSKMKPAQPSFAGLNAIYELKDVPGMLRQRLSKDGLKDISNYWLALQFGWEPLLADIRNFVLTQKGAQKRLKQLLRDNGRPVRRKITLSDTMSNHSENSGWDYTTFYPVFVTQYYQGDPTFRERTYDQERIWASGRFRYWLPPGPQDVNWKRNMMARIFGLRPSPSVVYNAIPWSWLVDWFSNVGDVINNLDAGVADRLASDYFYIMRQKDFHRERFSRVKFRRQSGEVFEVSGSANAHSFVKTRSEGDPFGFATDESTLSGMQLSILGALGMSRLR
jgi:hypothetical protein